ncbi:MAG: response regulator [Candidatus Omnitrophica bacterium]|nr:response regulator [Candidatus Omnitrophota bacterium]MDD5352251.1 response regulator [Candidatus Omnitrophota bacterium]MDD5549849.1 response regulator [Candidatus Omnitrophota bacterium]
MSKKRILICDDEVGIRESLNLILKDNYDISFCDNGQGCLCLLEGGEKFDLALLDIKMPKMSGLDILKKIKGKRPDLKVIIITGYKSVDTATEAINAGAVDYIVKPFAAKEILKSVERNI